MTMGTEPMSADPLTALNNEYGAEWNVRRPGRYVADHRRLDATIISDSVLELKILMAEVTARRAAERDEAVIARWREEAWPVIKGRRWTGTPGCLRYLGPALAASVSSASTSPRTGPGTIEAMSKQAMAACVRDPASEDHAAGTPLLPSIKIADEGGG